MHIHGSPNMLFSSSVNNGHGRWNIIPKHKYFKKLLHIAIAIAVSI